MKIFFLNLMVIFISVSANASSDPALEARIHALENRVTFLERNRNFPGGQTTGWACECRWDGAAVSLKRELIRLQDGFVIKEMDLGRFTGSAACANALNIHSLCQN